MITTVPKPREAPTGTANVAEVGEAAGDGVAAAPPIVHVPPAPLRFVPVTVTDEPRVPAVGATEVIVGADT